MTCNRCNKKITIRVGDDGTTQGEYDYEYGHKLDCRYFKTSDRVEVNRIYNAPMPVIKIERTEEDEKARKKYMWQKFIDENWMKR